MVKVLFFEIPKSVRRCKRPSFWEGSMAVLRIVSRIWLLCSYDPVRILDVNVGRNPFVWMIVFTKMLQEHFVSVRHDLWPIPNPGKRRGSWDKSLHCHKDYTLGAGGLGIDVRVPSEAPHSVITMLEEFSIFRSFLERNHQWCHFSHWDIHDWLLVRRPV